MKNVLVIEDEQNVAAFIKKGLNEAGYHVFIAYDGDTGLDLIQQKQIDFILLDVILPGKNGVEIAKEIRSRGHSETPILMLTALGTTDNIVNGLDAGADDYLIKPFKFKELLARLRALERRKNFTVSPQAKLKIANLELDTDAKVVKRDKDEIKLTSTEYRLLEYFMKNPNKVLSRIEILESVWDIGFDIGTNVVDVYVNYLRNKIEQRIQPETHTNSYRHGLYFKRRL